MRSIFILAKQLTPTVPDSVSLIDGRATFMELYTGDTIAYSSPPCPTVQRFCIKMTNNDNPANSDVFVSASRLVIRMVVASAALQNTKKENEAELLDQLGTVTPLSSDMSSTEESIIPHPDVTVMLPSFNFTLTVLSQNQGSTLLL